MLDKAQPEDCLTKKEFFRFLGQIYGVPKDYKYKVLKEMESMGMLSTIKHKPKTLIQFEPIEML